MYGVSDGTIQLVVVAEPTNEELGIMVTSSNNKL